MRPSGTPSPAPQRSPAPPRPAERTAAPQPRGHRRRRLALALAATLATLVAAASAALPAPQPGLGPGVAGAPPAAQPGFAPGPVGARSSAQPGFAPGPVGAPPPAGEPLSKVGADPFVPGEMLVRFKPGVDRDARADVLEDHGAGPRRSLPVEGLELVRLPPSASVTAAAADFERDPEVLYAEPNYYYRLGATPSDPRLGDLWGLDNTGQTVNGIAGAPDADVDALEAWDRTTGSVAVTAAVVDSGVAYDNPDLAPNVWANPGESGAGGESNGRDDDGNGLVDDARGWDFVAGDKDPRDFNGHGTHVAGTIGARGDDGQGVAGVGWRTQIMPLRACDANGLCPGAAIIAAFAYAGAKGAQVVNASFGGPGYSQAMLDAINAAPRTLFVAAAGNEANNNDASPRYPCSYTSANVICVAATTQTDSLASFSNYGAASVDLGAPGANVLSTQPAYGAPILSEGFEGDIGSTWTTGGTNDTWARTTEAKRSGSFSLTDSPAGNYLNGTNSFARTANPFSLAGEAGCRVEYALRLATERSTDPLRLADVLWVEASADGSTWAIVGGWSGSTAGSFLGLRSGLSAFDGRATVYLRFRLQSDAVTPADGAHVDDVAVRCLSSTYAGSEFAYASGTSMAAPHVVGAAALVWAVAPNAPVAFVRERLLGVVDRQPALAGRTASGGRVNAPQALPPPDDTAPDTTLTDGPTGATADPTPTFGLASSESHSTFECRVDEAAFAACPSRFTTASLPDGDHAFEARARDAQDNVDGSPARRTFTVDATPPETTITAGPTGPTDDATPTFSFSSSEPGSTFQCRVDAAGFAACESPHTTAALSDGAHTVQVRAADAVGNLDPTPANSGFTITRQPIRPPGVTPLLPLVPAVPPGSLQARDTVLAVTASARRAQRVLRQGGVVVEVGCPRESCTVKAAGRVTLRAGGARGGPRSVGLASVKRRVAPGGTARLRLGLSRQALEAVGRALRDRETVTARVTATARDAAGNTVTRWLGIRVR